MVDMKLIAGEMRRVADGQQSKTKMSDIEVAQAFLDLNQRLVMLEAACVELIKDVQKLKSPTIKRVSAIGPINGRH